MVEALDGRPLTWLSEELGETYKNVQRWVSGDTAPPVEFVGRFAAGTGTDGHWLLTGDGAMRRTGAERDTERRADAFDRVAAVVLEVVDYNATTPTDEEIAAELRRRGYLVDRDANGPEETHPEA